MLRTLQKFREGPAFRRGVGDLNGLGDTVGGIVIMRFGENTRQVVGRITEKLESLKKSLPSGVEVVETYNRRHLIERAVSTLTKELLWEVLVVTLVVLLFLFHLKSALIPLVTLVSSVVLSFIFMHFLGVSANIMSLGGIAIAVGTMVDAALVCVENVHKRLEQAQERQQQHEQEQEQKQDHKQAHEQKHEQDHKQAEQKQEQEQANQQKQEKSLILSSIKEVGPSSFFSLLVIAVSFLPLFALEAQEGRLFKPLAYTKTLTMFLAALLSITLVPVLLLLFIKRKDLRHLHLKKRRKKNPLKRWGSFLFKVYSSLVNKVVEHRKKVVLGSFLFVLSSVPLYLNLGSEFMPPLNEGTLLYMPTTMPGISITEAQKLLQKQDEILKGFPEVISVHGKAGKASTATDSAPLTMMETVLVLKNQKKWSKVKRWYSFLPTPLQFPFKLITPDYMSWEELIQKMNEKTQFPGLTNAWTMPIKGRLDMLSTGIRTPVGIKIAGADLEKIEKIGLQIEDILSSLPGTRSVFAERIGGGLFLDINFRREALARHGLSMKGAHEILATALGGRKVNEIIEGRGRYALQVRYGAAFRQNKEDLENILLDSPKGYSIPLKEVASLEVVKGAGVLRNENGLLTGYVFVDLKGSDVGSYVKRAKAQIEESLSLPSGYSLTWSGQYQSILRVRNKIMLVLPLTLLLIVLLMYLNTQSMAKTFMILMALPFSAVGAFGLLYLLDYNMSTAVWVGLIALLGIDAETGTYMLLYLDMAYEKRVREGNMKSFKDLRLAIHEGALQRIRPKFMTLTTTLMALLPLLWASSAQIGADVMKRMAAPMVGGIGTSFLMELLVYPALFALYKERQWKKSSPSSS